MYMQKYMQKKRGLNKEVLTSDVGLNKKAGLNKPVLSPKTKEVFIGGRKFVIEAP